MSTPAHAPKHRPGVFGLQYYRSAHKLTQTASQKECRNTRSRMHLLHQSSQISEPCCDVFLKMGFSAISPISQMLHLLVERSNIKGRSSRYGELTLPSAVELTKPPWEATWQWCILIEEVGKKTSQRKGLKANILQDKKKTKCFFG